MSLLDPDFGTLPFINEHPPLYVSIPFFASLFVLFLAFLSRGFSCLCFILSISNMEAIDPPVRIIFSVIAHNICHFSLAFRTTFLPAVFLRTSAPFFSS